MSDHFVTCRHCGVGINYHCDHEDTDVPAEDLAAAEALNASQADQIRVIYEQLTAAEARIRELEGALREIACRPCEGPPNWPDCPNATSGRELWCSECIARAALAPPPGDEKRGGEK